MCGSRRNPRVYDRISAIAGDQPTGLDVELHGIVLHSDSGVIVTEVAGFVVTVAGFILCKAIDHVDHLSFRHDCFSKLYSVVVAKSRKGKLPGRSEGNRIRQARHSFEEGGEGVMRLDFGPRQSLGYWVWKCRARSWERTDWARRVAASRKVSEHVTRSNTAVRHLLASSMNAESAEQLIGRLA